jgi:multidrug resistance efflux pump
MLNISSNSIGQSIEKSRFRSLSRIAEMESGRVFLKLITFFFILGFVMLFLPWTQNISADGNVTTLTPDQRPQTIPSVIPGRIEKWFVREGEFVNRGDTIVHISEIKDDYFDPQLLERTADQVTAKESAVVSYKEKAEALDKQIGALGRTMQLKLQQSQNKLQQARLKVISDSTDFQAAKINYQIAVDQHERMEELFEQGLKSKTDLENRKNKMQEAQAKMIAAENDFLASKNELINARVELSSVEAQYQDKMQKAESDKFSALSNMYDAEGTVNKLRNQYANYSRRTSLHYITSPIDGYITKALQVGIGETFHEGAQIVSIMPENYSLAVEMYVKPIDMPLIDIGQDVRIQFDGWPAIVFSGWPNTSYGTYGGEVFAIDRFISANGKFRIMVAPDPEDHPWPEALRVGGGTRNMLLLKTVPVWYELWRQINGFPPDFYAEENIPTSTSTPAPSKPKDK